MKSGSGDTCLANTIINYCYHLFAIAVSDAMRGAPKTKEAMCALCAKYNRGEKVLASPRDIINKTILMVLGDDNVTWVDASTEVDFVPSVLNALGLVSKLKPIRRPEDVMFLNNWFIEREPGEFMAIPNFFRLLGRSTTGYHCVQRRRLL